VTGSPYVNTAKAELKEIGNGGAFAAKVARLGPEIGLTGLGCTLTAVPPGKRAYPFHRHHVTDELFYVISGSGEYRNGDDRFAVHAGDLIGAPAGGPAHQLINTGAEELRYLAISTMPSADVLEYPDTGKVAYGAGVKNADRSTATIMGLGRLQPAGYYDGEPVS
jgi:uncharacterized cupin superfamily protein